MFVVSCWCPKLQSIIGICLDMDPTWLLSGHQDQPSQTQLTGMMLRDATPQGKSSCGIIGEKHDSILQYSLTTMLPGSAHLHNFEQATPRPRPF